MVEPLREDPALLAGLICRRSVATSLLAKASELVVEALSETDADVPSVEESCDVRASAALESATVTWTGWPMPRDGVDEPWLLREDAMLDDDAVELWLLREDAMLRAVVAALLEDNAEDAAVLRDDMRSS